MSPTPSPLAALFAECDARGVELCINADGRLTVDGPEDAVTPDLVARLKANKLDVLLVLHAERDADSVDAYPYEWEWLEAPTLPADAVCPCGSTTWRDVPIHHGQSVRRDCAKCGRFIEFPIWYGKNEVTSANDCSAYYISDT